MYPIHLDILYNFSYSGRILCNLTLSNFFKYIKIRSLIVSKRQKSVSKHRHRSLPAHCQSSSRENDEGEFLALGIAEGIFLDANKTWRDSR